ncbi:MAG: helix-hairpin-helix domain-containing protein [Dehalococcoides mccartyi]|jgi:DNA uptake protein and related DNA-binding proteins|uniref:Competence protein ComEA n=2 Tax=root TaxID=1 RepID=A0AB33HUS6_9CHLR|nr:MULTISPECIES: helix-hairpin-helix domain-containing protein [Dehalococcoides]MBF4482375.1 helix-hairpin-helix domain-containing protein [Dehalococcoides mccartyi]MBJ7531661.1 helix-hairpin-helix domain-containing protein [Dehalococcoides mccartyi]MDP4279635.1 helix-hairpin-helix domain-containing protein [Dehalococcoides mccartyi]MEA4878705.1 helix-hairpin-helix domain-containing protein [Dehalococcoides mccartyi]OBW60819.1 MAG: competence protein ComEA [Dehalococcoides mccartyi]
MKVTKRFALLLGLALAVLSAQGCSETEPLEVYTPSQISPNQLEINISGNIKLPGIYPGNTRDTLQSLLEAAGGLMDNSELTTIYLSFNPPVSGSSAQKIDLNRAEIWLLVALPGIGEARANDIVTYRNQNGGFKNTLELMLIPGFSQSLYDQIKDLICVSETADMP